MKMEYVYICYDWKDLKHAERVAETLRSDGIEFLLEQKLRVEEQLNKKIREAACVVWVVTASSLNNAWVHRDAHSALELNKLIPVFVEKNPGSLFAGHPPFASLHALLLPPNEEPEQRQALLHSVRRFVKTRRIRSHKRRVSGAGRHRIFISHAAEDKRRIAPIVLGLADAGFGLWIDRPHEMGFGEAAFRSLRISNIAQGGGLAA
jgi:hypothetical protein